MNVDRLYELIEKLHKPTEEIAIFLNSYEQEIDKIKPYLCFFKKETYVYNIKGNLNSNIINIVFATSPPFSEINRVGVCQLDTFNLAAGEENIIDLEGESMYLFSDGSKLLFFQNERYNKLFIIEKNQNKINDFVLEHRWDISGLSVLELENLIATSGSEKLVKIWDLKQEKCIESFKLKYYAEYLYMPNSRLLIGWEGNPMLWIWSLEQHQFLWESNDTKPASLEINKNEDILFVGTEDGKIESYSLANGEKNWSCEINSEKNKLPLVSYLKIISEQLIAVTCKENIYLINSILGEKINILTGHKGTIVGLEKLNEQYLISSGFDETIRIWDLKSSQYIAILIGHIHRIQEMIIVANGSFLITKDRASMVLLWNLQWLKTNKK